MNTQDELIRLKEKTGLNWKAFAQYFDIPYRTMQDWYLGKRSMPDYLLRLMSYKIETEKLRRPRWYDPRWYTWKKCTRALWKVCWRIFRRFSYTEDSREEGQWLNLWWWRFPRKHSGRDRYQKSHVLFLCWKMHQTDEWICQKTKKTSAKDFEKSKK